MTRVKAGLGSTSANRYEMRSRLVLALLAVTLTGPLAVTSADAAGSKQGPKPYVAPSFHCKKVHHYGNGKAPDPLTIKDDPLCVIYNKRDITADNGGLIRFLEAEPARFAVAGKCQYWQRDHWRVRVDRGVTTVVGWDGSYWFDIPRGKGAGILRNFKIDGHRASASQAAKAIRPASKKLARQFKKFGAKGGGGGASVALDHGLPHCTSSTG
jgi:hypothetical protein